jgi:hypothetical protein
VGGRLPIHPALADVIAAMSASGYWALALDKQWRVVAETAEQAAVTPGGSQINGTFHFGPEGIAWAGAADMTRESVRQMGGWMLLDLGVDRRALSALLHPELRSVVDEIKPVEDLEALSWDPPTEYLGENIGLTQVAQRVRGSAVMSSVR